MKILDRCIHYKNKEVPVVICMSSTGIFIDCSGTAIFEPEFRTAATMHLKGDNEEYVLAIDPSVEIKGTGNQNVVKAKKYVHQNKERIYAIDLENKEDIKEIRIGEFVYTREN